MGQGKKSGASGREAPTKEREEGLGEKEGGRICLVAGEKGGPLKAGRRLGIFSLKIELTTENSAISSL